MEVATLGARASEDFMDKAFDWHAESSSLRMQFEVTYGDGRSFGADLFRKGRKLE
jgi:hypothetical protein